MQCANQVGIESELESFARRERVSQKWPCRASPCLVVEREDGVLVDVVGGHDRQRLEPRHLELLRDRHEGLARHLQIRNPSQQEPSRVSVSTCEIVSHLGEVGQITRVDADADGAVPEVVQGQRHRSKVKQSAPASESSFKRSSTYDVHWFFRILRQPIPLPEFLSDIIITQPTPSITSSSFLAKPPVPSVPTSLPHGPDS